MTTSPAQLFDKAVHAFQNGRVIEAETLCRDLLTQAPPNPVWLHLLGVIRYQQGHSADAENFLRQSLALYAQTPEVHHNLGLALMAQGKYADALEPMQRAVELSPFYAQAHYQLGNIWKKINAPDKAIAAYERSLKAQPQSIDTLHALGVLLCEQNRRRDAIGYFEKILTIKPDFPEALNNLAAAHLDLDEPDSARAYCQRALTLRPDYTAALNNLGNVHRATEEYERAIDCYRRALAIDPTLLEPRCNLGLCLMYGHGDLEAAKACFHDVLAIDAHHTYALNNLGIVLCQQSRFEEGITAFKQALDQRPDYIDALSNYGSALRATGHADEARAAYNRVIELKPDFPEAQNNLAMIMLSAGEFDEGFRCYEWRWKTKQLKDAHRTFSQPQWQGEDVKGRTILIHAEQGFGDTLQFCRYANDAATRGAKVVMEVPAPLVRIVQSLECKPQVIATGEVLPAFDVHCPMLSLPIAFKTQLDTVPNKTPYLFADAEELAVWKNRLPPTPSIKKIGLVWAGNPRKHSFDLASIDRQRSMPAEHLLVLKDVPNVAYYSLQKDGPPPPQGFPLIDHMNECRDFAATAALIMQLDLIISVDTSVVHLAGALGKPVWMLNRFDTCWRWLYKCDDSPWYPTLRQFRQTSFGDWEGVMQRVAGALRNR